MDRNPVMIRAKGDGITIQLADRPGEKTPLLCIHGLTANCRCFDIIAEALSPENRVLAMDLRGRGLSDKPAGGYSIDRHCADIGALLNDLGIRKVRLLGHSLGAYIALAFASQHQDTVEKLILMDAGAQLSAEQWAKIAVGIKPSLDRLEQSFSSFEEYIGQVKKASYLQPWNQAVEDYFRYESHEIGGVYRSRIDPKHILEERTNLAGTDTSVYYAGIRCPVLILRATEGMASNDDLVLPEEAMEPFMNSLPKAVRVDLTGSNHYSMLLQPNVQRDRAIAEFLRE